MPHVPQELVTHYMNQHIIPMYAGCKIILYLHETKHNIIWNYIIVSLNVVTHADIWVPSSYTHAEACCYPTCSAVRKPLNCTSGGVFLYRAHAAEFTHSSHQSVVGGSFRG